MRVHILHVPGAHAERDQIVRDLTATPGIETCVHLDPERRGCMWNWLRALVCAAQTDGEQEWTFILSDDAEPALPAPQWIDELRAATEHSPARVLGLTHFGGWGKRAAERGAPYASGGYTVWGGAIGYRRDLVQPLARWAVPVVQRTGYPHDDVLVAAYMHRIGEPLALTSRAIFGQPVKQSLLGHNTPIRHPYLTIADPGPAWDAEPRAVNAGRSTPQDVRDLAREEP